LGEAVRALCFSVANAQLIQFADFFVSIDNDAGMQSPAAHTVMPFSSDGDPPNIFAAAMVPGQQI
jgi:hypothetical protein